MATLGTCLWFDDEAEEAARFYTSVFPGSRIVSVNAYPTETPSDKPVGSTKRVFVMPSSRAFAFICATKALRPPG